jgi:D-alanine-D-alanine ligase
MTPKTNIAVLFGGQSAEHEVSIESAKNVLRALDPDRYQINAIFISRQGEWFLMESQQAVLDNPAMKPLADMTSAIPLALQPGHPHPIFHRLDPDQHLSVDVVFPVLHGVHGEDGTMQGMLELFDIAYVGPDVLGSAVAMDKEFTKQLLKAANIPVADWITIHQDEIAELDFNLVTEKLGVPLFIKPAKTGSSVGISKVSNQQEFEQALELAQQYDHKILIEANIAGREIECAVLGNRELSASVPGEIIPHYGFYSYEAKYLDPEGASLKAPAELDDETVERVRHMAKKAFAALGCEGMARVDFFLTADDKLIVNEANTIPGFTEISMYPKLWGITGLPYPKLIDHLIELALERHKRDRVLVDAH